MLDLRTKTPYEGTESPNVTSVNISYHMGDTLLKCPPYKMKCMGLLRTCCVINKRDDFFKKHLFI